MTDYATDEALARRPVYGDLQAVVDAGASAAAPHPLGDDGRYYVVTAPRGAEASVIDLEQQREWTRTRPRRAAGRFTVHDADSFVAYLARHDTAEAEVWADLGRQRLTAVLNAHGRTDPPERVDTADPPRADGPEADTVAGWQDHRLELDLRQTPEWQAWTALDTKLCEQAELAEHIEDHVDTIIEPTGATMLELVQHFHATTGVTFQSSKALSSGERQLTYRENVEASAGKTGQLTIPATFNLALAPFDGLDPYKVRARFRYRMTGGRLTIGYALNRPADVLRAAFTDQLTAVEDNLGGTVPIYAGAAPDEARR